MLAYREAFRYVATNEETGERRAFQLYHNASPTGGAYDLRGYDPQTNGLNHLEDFDVSPRPSLSTLHREARKRIRFYLGGGWTIENRGKV